VTRHAVRLWIPALLVLSLPACLAPEDYVENRCSATPTFERLGAQAAQAAGEPYLEHSPVACPEVDRPPDGNKAAEGLVFEEYAAITAGSAGNFLDDNTWWVKALPRGEIHQSNLLLSDESCLPVNYDRFSYDYSAATPPILEPPSCAKALSALQIGHSFFQTSPQVLELEATAYARLASLSLNPVFGTTLRFATENATHDAESFPYLGELELTGHDPKMISFVARLSGVTFEAVLDAELVPASTSTLKVRLRIYPRAGADSGVSLGVAALSSMFWKRDADTPDVAGDEAHDSDQLYVKSQDGIETTTALENPELSLAPDPWQRRTFAGPFDTISLVQSERDPQMYAAYESARYADRPSFSIGEITASVPLSAELAIVHASDEYIDNVVLDLIADTNRATVPIEVSYVLTAEAN
jgi:hypothetical protein